MKIAIVTAAAVAALSGSAMATVYSWNFAAGQPQGPGLGTYGINNSGGTIASMTASFDNVSNQFSFAVQFSNRTTNGFWLAVSPGPNPKGHSGELALIYFDASNQSAPRATAYAYNGNNASNSYLDGTSRPGTQTPDFIGALINGVNSTLTFANTSGGGRRLSMSFDATFIQNHLPLDPIDRARNEWTGLAFGQNLGIWFHAVDGLQTSYNSQGRLTNFSYTKEGWLDGEGFTTVPTPGAAAALALAGLASARRRRA
jgi:MYXO-CTERM domain-containing protein